MTTQLMADERMPSRIADETITGVPFARLVKLELRKLVDTRAGRVLLAVVVALLVGISLIPMLAGKPTEDKNFNDFLQIGSIVLQLLLPIIGILAVTSEWSQRTGLVTFTLEPRRTRVALSKWAASAIMGLLGVATGFAVAAVFTLLTDIVRGSDPSWSISWEVVLGIVVGQLLYISIGVAFGMLIQNTPGAIVAYLLIPSLWSMVGSFSWMANISAWADTTKTMGPLLDASMQGDDWAKLGVSLLIWLVIPMVAGIWRMTHSEVKSG
ncbi:ABC transporter permease [Flexivirga sp. ID2601S]|uniref:ABC transporter permease n=1 Tax=Flexivirga aerilata TaxID=1656889 RepID=A0A849AKK2_9MICO|nr:ABC transporter permease [Flexivirga aerilata]NNG39798.1 ABC transporter permease [Flexivirga aerilata]